jgi:hypothetical protein
MTSILDALTPLPQGTRVFWHFIGGTRRVVAMDAAARSVDGEPRFVIRYVEHAGSILGERQRMAYASDLTVKLSRI